MNFNFYIIFCGFALVWMYFLHRIVMPVDLVIDFIIYPLLGQDVFDLREDDIKKTGLYKTLNTVSNNEEEVCYEEEYYTPLEGPPQPFSD